MNGGILLSWFNMNYFRDQLSIYCEFIPQMIFLNGLFGYLCILIMSKWISGSTADLYHVMIYMFLSPGTGGLACLDASGNYGCKENIMFPGQGPLQVLLLACCAYSHSLVTAADWPTQLSRLSVIHQSVVSLVFELKLTGSSTL